MPQQKFLPRLRLGYERLGCPATVFGSWQSDAEVVMKLKTVVLLVSGDDGGGRVQPVRDSSQKGLKLARFAGVNGYRRSPHWAADSTDRRNTALVAVQRKKRPFARPAANSGVGTTAERDKACFQGSGLDDWF